MHKTQNISAYELRNLAVPAFLFKGDVLRLTPPPEISTSAPTQRSRPFYIFELPPSALYGIPTTPDIPTVLHPHCKGIPL